MRKGGGRGGGKKARLKYDTSDWLAHEKKERGEERDDTKGFEFVRFEFY